MVPSLQLVNLHDIIVTQSPQLTLGFTLIVCILWVWMTCTHYYNIIQSIFTALKVPCALPIHPPFPPPPGDHFFSPLIEGPLFYLNDLAKSNC